MDPADEVESLRREVTALRRTVDTLVELLLRADAFGAMDRAQVQRRLSAAARAALEEEESEADVDEPAALATSAYRGAVPGAGRRGCAICGRGLEEDDPELVLEKRGRVCVSCFHRGGDR